MLSALESESLTSDLKGGRFAFEPETGVHNPLERPPGSCPSPSYLSPVLTILSEMPPATYPAGLIVGNFHVFLRETGWEDVGAVLHRGTQLQQDDVTSLAVESVVVLMNDDRLH